MAAEEKRIMNVDNGNNHDSIDHTYFEQVDQLCNNRNDEYDTLLTYRIWREQFRILTFPSVEQFQQRTLV